MNADGSGQRRRLRRGVGLCLVAAAAASLALAALASGLGGQQEAAQSITVTLGKGTTTVSGADALVSGLTKITARNTGTKPTNFALARLRPGKTLADLTAEVTRSSAFPEDSVATITTTFGLAPGKSFVTTLKLPPGDYVTTQPPDGKGLGPATAFTIADGVAGGTPPKTTGTVTLYDYGIKAPASIRGHGTVAIHNIGLNYHFVLGIRLNRGVDPAKVIADIRANRQGGPPPGEFIQIIGIVSPGTVNYVRTDLKPGTYVIACFNSDRHSAGHNHAQFGMVRKLIVK